MNVGMIVKKVDGNDALHIVQSIDGQWCSIRSGSATLSYCKHNEVEVQPYPFVLLLNDGSFVAATTVTVMQGGGDPATTEWDNSRTPYTMILDFALAYFLAVTEGDTYTLIPRLNIAQVYIHSEFLVFKEG